MKPCNRNARYFVLAATLLIACVGFAQAQDTTARISGQITDATGAVIPNAEITLVNINTREERKSKTEDSGYYSLTQIAPGVYDLSVKVQGFKEHLNKAIELSINDSKTKNSPLKPASETKMAQV